MLNMAQSSVRTVMLDESLSSPLRAQLGQGPFGGREIGGTLDPVARRGYLLRVPHGEDARAPISVPGNYNTYLCHFHQTSIRDLTTIL